MDKKKRGLPMKRIIAGFMVFISGLFIGGGTIHFMPLENTKTSKNLTQLQSSTEKLDEPTDNTPLVTFVDDDGEESFISQYVPILEKYQIKGCGSIIMGTQGLPGYATKDQLLDLQKQGWDILNHSCDIDQLTDSNYKAKIDYALYVAKQDDFVAAKRIFVYPNGFSDTTIQSYAGLYFNYGLNADGNVNQINNFLKMNCSRYFLDPSLSQDKIIQEIQSMLKENNWLIVSTHSWEKDGLKNLEPVITYLKSKDVKILTATQAIDEIEKK